MTRAASCLYVLVVALASVLLAGCGDPERPATPTRAAADAASAVHSTQDIVGFWESEDATRGGLGNYMDLRPDGSMASGICAMVEMTWTLEGARLTLGASPPADEALSALRVEFVGDEMVLRPWEALPPMEEDDGTERPTEMRKRRRTPAIEGASPLVGDWISTHYTGGSAYERYTADGRVHFRVPMPAAGHAMRYEVKGSAIEMTVDGGPPTRMAFVRRGDTLQVTPEGKTARTYRFVPAGAWYEPPTADQLQAILDAAKAQGVGPK